MFKWCANTLKRKPKLDSVNKIYSACLYGKTGQHGYWVIAFLMPWSYMVRVKRIWYLSPMRAAKVQASLRIRTVSPEPPLLAHTSNESRGTFRQKAKSLTRLNGWACAVKICHDGMLEDTNSLDAAHLWCEQMLILGYVDKTLIIFPFDDIWTIKNLFSHDLHIYLTICMKENHNLYF